MHAAHNGGNGQPCIRLLYNAMKKNRTSALVSELASTNLPSISSALISELASVLLRPALVRLWQTPTFGIKNQLMVMCMDNHVAGLCNVIENNATEYHDDINAFAVIHRAMPQEM
jgi:hypothetical protein